MWAVALPEIATMAQFIYVGPYGTESSRRHLVGCDACLPNPQLVAFHDGKENRRLCVPLSLACCIMTNKKSKE
jgi:hypothetical protein